MALHYVYGCYFKMNLLMTIAQCFGSLIKHYIYDVVQFNVAKHGYKVKNKVVDSLLIRICYLLTDSFSFNKALL